MTPESFIEAIRIAVTNSAVTDVISDLKKPPGRKPAENLVRNSSWYNGLSEADKAMVAEVGKEFADSVAFGFLCVIDGVRAIGEDGAVVKFELYCKKGDETVRLNPDCGEFLHDLYNSQ